MIQGVAAEWSFSRLSAEQKLKREVNTINNNQLINLKN